MNTKQIYIAIALTSAQPIFSAQQSPHEIREFAFNLTRKEDGWTSVEITSIANANNDPAQKNAPTLSNDSIPPLDDSNNDLKVIQDFSEQKKHTALCTKITDCCATLWQFIVCFNCCRSGIKKSN